MQTGSRMTTTSSSGYGASSDRNDLTGVKFAKLRYFWEETSSSSGHDAVNSTHSYKNVTHTTIDTLNSTSEKVVIKLYRKKELKCI
jgi:hypothetical protein